MYEEITTCLNKRDYVTAKELWLLQKYAMEIISSEYKHLDITGSQKEYITDKDLEIVI